jgi:hypothetical protein
VLHAAPASEKRSKAGGKSDAKPEAGKRGAAEPATAGRGTGGSAASKKSKRGSEEEGGDGAVGDVSVKLLELPSIMPPPPCLFVQAIISPAEAGTQYPFEAWSLNQLDGLASDFGELLFFCFLFFRLVISI